VLLRYVYGVSVLLYYSALLLDVRRNVDVTGVCVVNTLCDLYASW
jgi:hypothetical protein